MLLFSKRLCVHVSLQLNYLEKVLIKEVFQVKSEDDYPDFIHLYYRRNRLSC